MRQNPPLLPKTKANSRRLRREMTIPERLLWGKLRGGRVAGLKFRRQYPIDQYIADFYCHAHRLVIELDGDSHIGTAAYDGRREAHLAGQRIRVMRFSNEDVIRDLEAFLTAILAACGISVAGTSVSPPAKS
jgi:very-short-patch-repair endonuclease